MGTESGAVGEEKVRFLGKVIASISHELKNSLATVHETAGLLSDVLKSAGDSAEDAEEVLRCADDISEELERAFGVIRNLNVFAHSADDPLREVSAAEVAGLAAALVGYQSYAGRIRFDEGEAGGPRITTSPLLLEDLVYRVLDDAFRAGGRETELSLAARPREGGVEIVIGGLGFRDEKERVPEAVRPVLAALGGSAETREGEVRFRLPDLRSG